MPPDTGRTIFAVARVAGWAAHYMEELTERPLRFRARAVYSRLTGSGRGAGAGQPGADDDGGGMAAEVDRRAHLARRQRHGDERARLLGHPGRRAVGAQRDPLGDVGQRDRARRPSGRATVTATTRRPAADVGGGARRRHGDAGRVERERDGAARPAASSG